MGTCTPTFWNWELKRIDRVMSCSYKQLSLTTQTQVLRVWRWEMVL